MRRLSILLLVSLPLVLGGCKRAEKDKKSKKTGDPRLQPVPKKTEISRGSKGTGKMYKLRYKFRAGDQYKLVIDMRMTMKMRIGNLSPPTQDLPTMRTIMRVTHEKVSSKGELTARFRVTSARLLKDVSVEPRMAARLRQAMGLMEKLEGAGVVTPRGISKDVTIKLPPGLPPTLRQIIENFQQQMSKLSTPFPVEPVGVGAKWEVKMPINTPMIRVGQVATFTLRRVEGNTVHCDTTVLQWAPPQELKAPNMPRGATINLKSMKTTGSGTVAINLTRLVPSSQLKAHTKMVQKVKAMGRTQHLTMDMTMKVITRPGS